MKRWGVAALVAALVGLGAGTASAQEDAGASRWEVAGFPGGGLIFTESSRESNEGDFADYALGGSLTYNLNRYWGIEGEIGGAFGIDQRIGFSNGPSIGDASPPDVLVFQGGAVFYPFRNDRAFVPYVTGGIGGLTMFEEARLGVEDTETFFTGNAGGGAKWYFGRWGIRADYRFLTVASKDDAPAFFGRDTRYGHRVYGGVLFGFGR